MFSSLCRVLLFLISPLTLFGTSFTWVGGASGEWTTLANWNPSSDYPHTSTDDAIFPSGGISVDLSDVDISIATMSFNGDSTITTSMSFPGLLHIYSGISILSEDVTVEFNVPISLENTIAADLADNSTLSFGNQALTGTGGFELTGPGGGLPIELTYAGAGVTTYSGPTIITSGGNLVSLDNNVLSPNSTISLASYGVLQLNGIQTIANLSGTGTLQMYGGALTLGDAQIITYAGFITDGVEPPGTITKQGSGTFTLTEVNDFTGTMSVTDGTLSIGGAGSIAAISSLTLSGDAVFSISAASGSVTIPSLASASGTSSVALGSNTLIVGNSSSTTFVGTIGGTGGLIKQGSGTFTLTGVNTFTGAMSVTDGTLSIGGAGSIATISSLTLSGDAIFSISAASGSVTIPSLASSSSMSSVALGANTLVVGNSASTTFVGSIGGTGGLTKQGSGTLTLSGTNTFTGPISIAAGTLSLGAVGSISDESTVSLGDATLDISAAGGDVTLVSLASSSSISSVTLGANTLIVGSASSTTFGGSIGGTGGVTKQGSGTLTLSGVNSFTGAVSILDGTLGMSGSGSIANASSVSLGGTAALSISGASGSVTILSLASASGTSSVALGSNTLVVGNSSSTTFAGSIGGTGSLTKQGSGTLTLSGTNTFSGGLTIAAGVINATNNAQLGDSSGGINLNGGTLKFGGSFTVGSGRTVSISSTFTGIDTNGNTGTIAGPLSGTGNLLKAGAGTLNLTNGSSNFSGVIIVEEGTLGLTGSGSIATSSSLILLDSTIFSISGASGDATIQSLVSAASSSSIALGANTLIVGNSSSTTFAGSIGGTGGFTKQGTGTLTLTGTNAFSGPTLINRGILTINGSFSDSDITVGPIAVLKGSGPVSSNITVNGTLAPGSSIGTFSTTGDVLFTENSIYEVELDPSSADLLLVTGMGSVTIDAGAILSIVPTLGAYPSTVQYTVIDASDAAGGLTNQFTIITNSAPLFFSPTPIYQGNRLLLEVSTSSFGDLVTGEAGNAGAVAACLHNLVPPTGSDLYNVLSSLLTVTSLDVLTEDLNQMQPSQLTALAMAQENISVKLSSQVGKRGNQYQTDCFEKHAKEWNLWLDLLGDFNKQTAQNQEPGFSTQNGGALLGLERFFSKEAFLGLSGAYSYSHLKWTDQAGHANTNSYYGLLYGSTTFNHVWLQTSAIGAYNHYNVTRNIQIPNFNRKATHGNRGFELGGNLTFGVPFEEKEILYTPYLSNDFLYLYQGSFQEYGAQSLDLNVRSFNAYYLRQEAGIDFKRCRVHANYKVVLDLTLAYVREWRFGGDQYQANLQDQTCVFTVYGMAPDRNLFAPSVEFSLFSSEDKSLVSLKYAGLIGPDFLENTLNFQASYSF